MSDSLKKLASQFFDCGVNDIDSRELECFKNELERFCESGKKEDAFSVYYCYSSIFKTFGKETLSKLIKFLSDHEFHAGELLKKHRDHYSHSVYVFSLGLAMYANNKPYRDALKKFYGDSFSNRDFLNLWGLIGLFHDIGYPFQLAHEQIREMMKDVFGIEDIEKKGFKHNPHVSYTDLDRLLTISNKWKKQCGFKNVKDLNDLFAKSIKKRFDYLEYKDIIKCLRKRPSEAVFMDHGYFSALLMAQNLMKEKVNLTEPLLDALTAIMIHNSIMRFYIAKDHPTEISTHPLAYLIMFMDECQKWDRQAFGLNSKKSPLPWKFDIAINDEKMSLVYTLDDSDIIEGKPSKKQLETLDKKKIKIDEISSFFHAKPEEITNKHVTIYLETRSFRGDIKKAIVPHIDYDVTYNFAPKQKEYHTYASTNKLLNIEKFARRSFETYWWLYMRNSSPYDQMSDDEFQKMLQKQFFEDPLFYQLDNIDQGKSYAWKLELVNCLYSDEDMDYPVVREFDHDDMMYLAAQEHVRWVRNRIRYGWKYTSNPKQDKVNKLHPDIYPFELLPKLKHDPNLVKKDLDTVKTMISLLKEDGIKIYSFRENKKPVFRIFGVGHRDIDLTNKEEISRIEKEIESVLKEYQKKHRVILKTCFARGSDMLIAKVAVKLGISIDAILPYELEEYLEEIKKDSINKHYEFKEEEINEWRNLLAQTIFCHECLEKSNNRYYDAMIYGLNHCDAVIALWDELELKFQDKEGRSINEGGTYHTIVKAKEAGKDVHTIKCHRIFK